MEKTLYCMEEITKAIDKMNTEVSLDDHGFSAIAERMYTLGYCHALVATALDDKAISTRHKEILTEWWNIKYMDAFMIPENNHK